MTLLTGLRYPGAPPGWRACQGYLPLADRTAAERSEANRRCAHLPGARQEDEIVAPAAVSLGAMRSQALGPRSSGMSTRWSTQCAPRIGALNQWLLRALGALP